MHVDRISSPEKLALRAQRGAARVLVALLALLIAVAGVVAVQPPAHAALHNIFPADADGTPQGFFYADDALFATMTSDTAGGVVCIVSDDVLDPSSANCQTGFAWGKPHTYIGMGTLAGYPLSAPPLPVGKWRLLITDITGKNGTELSDVFEVRPCRDTCDTAAATSQLAPWKARAAGAMDSVETLEYISAADKAMSLFNNLSGVLTDVVKGGGPIGVMMGIGTAAIEAQFANAWDTHKNLAMSILRPLYATSYRMWGDISRDPPRDDYLVDTQPDFDAVPTIAPTDFTPNLSAGELAVMQNYLQFTMEATAYGDASRLANERYMGALADAEYEAATSQALAASGYTFQLVQRLRALVEMQTQVAAMDWAQQPAVSAALFSVPGRTPSEAFQDVITQAQTTFAGGVSDEDRASLKACEFYETPPAVGDCPVTDAMIDAVAALWQDPDYVASWRAVDLTQTPAEALGAYTSELPGIIEAYDLFGRWMGLKAGEAEVLSPTAQPNRKPAAKFAQTRTQGAAPLTVTFTSQSTDPDGDDLSLHWDIAGARQVYDETSVVHTFNRPGTYWIGLTATDSDGLWDQAIQKVEVYPGDGPGGTEPPGNQAPVAGFSPVNAVLGPPDQADATPPYTQTFSAIGDNPADPLSFDPDGDSLTYTWHFGDGTSYTGPEVTKQFEAGYIMSVLLVVSDGWRTTQASGEVTANRADGSTPPGGNHPPIVVLTADPDRGSVPLQVLFSATATDEDGDALTYQWDFGDGQADGNKRVVAHTYTQPGMYEATVTVSDGRATASARQVVTVAAPTESLGANFTVGGGYDAASALHGARMFNTGVPSQASYPAVNLLWPTSEWRTPNSVTGEQTIIIDLAGGGRDLLDRVVLTGVNANTSVKTFSVALATGANPFAGYHTVLDHQELAQVSGPQIFTFAPQTARYLRLTVHDNRGGGYLRLLQLSAPTAGRDGGIVSLNTGIPASVVSVSSDRPPSVAANILLPNSTLWSTARGAIANQSVRIALGGDGPHTLSSIALRGSTSASSVKDFEVWASMTGADGTFTQVLSGTLQRNGDLQSFPLTAPATASHLELRLKNNHGDANFLYLYEMHVLTEYGLNVANGTGVGAQVVDSSGHQSSNTADNALAPGSAGRWLIDSPANQHFTVLLRNGDLHTIDRAVISPGAYRPKNVEIQVSADGTSYTTVAARQLADVADDQTIAFAPVAARFVKLVIVDGYHSTYVGVQRFRVFAVDRGGHTAVPFTDLSTGTATSWAWDFGDGGSSSERHPVHTFPGPGTYPVSLTVTGGEGTKTMTRPYTVPEQPTVTIDAASSTVDEGASVSLTARTDGIPVVQWDWDLGYSKPSNSGATLSARFADDGSYTVTVLGLTADGVWTDPVSRTFTVDNVPPSVVMGSGVSGLAGDPVIPAVSSISDPGADTLTCTWDWGDGTADETINNCRTATAKVPHTYALPGNYTATLTVSDGDGGVTTGTAMITALIRPTFFQITGASAVGGDLLVSARLVDTAGGTGVPGASVQLAADGATTQTAITDANGVASVTIPGASDADRVSTTFAGTALHEASSLARAVRAPRADIVFVVDESGSMGSYQDAVRANLQTIARGLGANLDYQLGVVGYAGTDYRSNGMGHVHSALTADLTQFYRASNELVATNASANGYEGVVVGSGFTVQGNAPDGALVDSGQMGFRPAAASCLVLVSDAYAAEIPQAAPKATRAHAEQALASRGTTVFALTADEAGTHDAYGVPRGLAGQTGGDWWDIKQFAKDPTEVLEALVTKCVNKASTPDLSVAIDTPATVAGNASFSATVTATNESFIDTPQVTVSATLPSELTFESASGGGTFDADARTVTWPVIPLLEARASMAYTVTAHRDTTGLAPGDYSSAIAVQVGYNGSLGAEATMVNNTAASTVTVQVPEPQCSANECDPPVCDGAECTPDPQDPAAGEIGIRTEIDPADAPQGGAQFTYPLNVTYSGTGPATNVVVLHQVPDRLAVQDLVLPAGWKNGYDDASGSAPPLTGPHPDGETPGEWIYLTAASIDPNGPHGHLQITVTATVEPLVLPAVIDDVGSLDRSSLPPTAAPPTSTITSQACVSGQQNNENMRACTNVTIPVKDIIANVTVRLYGGITYLVVSVGLTEVLRDVHGSYQPVTLTWTPGGTAPDLPEPVVVENLEPGRNYVIPWPGGAVDANGSAVGWPGWRAITDADRNAAGDLLDPVTGDVLGAAAIAEIVRGERILDRSLPAASWRLPSTLTFSVNPAISFDVTYREELPTSPDPTEPPELIEPDGTGNVPRPDQSGPPTGVPDDARPIDPPARPSIDVEAAGAEELAETPTETVTIVRPENPDLARTGVHNVFDRLVGGLLLLVMGGALVLAYRRRVTRRPG